MKIREMQARLQQSRGYKWWVLGMIMLGTFMAVLDVTVVNVGIPTIMSAFHIRISSAEWVITAYMITMTIMLPSAGWLADRYGNKKLYLGGMVIFTLGSWLCGRAGTDGFLIAARALQGVGSGMIQSLGLAIVTREFPPRQRGVALGLWSVAAAASISFGPLLGGFLVEKSWHLIFDINVPIGIFAVLLGLFVQKEWKKSRSGPFRLARIYLHCRIHAVDDLCAGPGNAATNPQGWSSPVVIGCFIVAAVALAVFIAAEWRQKHPLLNIRLLKDLHFGVSMVTLFIFGIGMLGGTYLLPLYMQEGLGYTAVMAGSVFSARRHDTGRPFDRFRGAHSLCETVGARFSQGDGYVGELLSGEPFHDPHLACANHAGPFTCAVSGWGLPSLRSTFFSLQNLTQQQMAAAAGISNSIKQLSGSIGIAVLTSILTYRTAFHTARETVSHAQSYVEGVTDDFLVVTFITLASMLPFVWMLLRRRGKPLSVQADGKPANEN